MKKWIAWLLCLCLVLPLLPVGALATDTESQTTETEVTAPATEPEVPETEAPEESGEPEDLHAPLTAELPLQINPLYEGIIDPATVSRPQRQEISRDDQYHAAAYFTTEEKAAVQVRDYLKARTASFTVYVKSDNHNYNEIAANLLTIAFEHTGKPTEGDYLMWHWETQGGSVVRNYVNGKYEHELTFDFTYYTTAEQEKEMDTAVRNLLNTLNVRYKSAYEKVCAVYDYICENVTYDYEHLEDTTYTRMFTAYAALIDKTAVCQGYATLFYRLMLELGVDTRVITGVSGNIPHAWNIVKLGDVYYNVDSTWDAGMEEYSCFLRNTENFPGHARYLDYMTYEFHTEYPMSETDYVDGVKGVPEKIYVRGICGENAYWTLDREGTLTILGEGDTDNFTIRNGYDDGGPWVYWYDQITSLVVEEGVTHIGDSAFRETPKLTSISLPDTLVSIGDHAFAYCYELTKINIPDSVTSLSRGVFRECTAVTELKLSSSLTVISTEAFRSLDSLESVVIPEGVTRLASMAFAYCNNLKDISFPSTLKTIESAALTECDSLTELNLPDSLESIAGNSFQNCDGLIEVTIPAGVEEADGFSGCDNLETVILNNNGIVSVYAFAECPKLKSIIFNGEITEIQDSAFSGCTSLTEITIPESVIKLSGFSRCSNLEKVVLNNSGVISSDAFEDCKKLKEVVFSGEIYEIHYYAFRNCKSLTTITIPYSVNYIAGFENCTGLQEIYFRGAAPTFKEDTFKNVTATVYYPAEDPSWTESVRQQYEGQLTWVAYEHEHQLIPGGTVEPTCTEQGYTYEFCTFCGGFIKDNIVAALGHDVVTHEGKEPSGVNGGWEAYETCTRCDYTTYVELPPECDVLFVGASLSLKGDIGLNFYAEVSERLLTDGTAYMTFTGSGDDRQIRIARGVLDESDGSYRYSFPLNAKNMGDSVTAQAVSYNQPVGDSKTLSIKYYADYVINNSSKENFVNLMKAMLNYGAAAQVNFGYDVENLVNADMAEADRLMPETLDASAFAHSWTGEEEGLEITSASLLLQSETKIRIYFKLAEGKTIDDFTFTIDGEEVTPVQSGDEYYIEKANVAAKDLDTMYTFCLGNRQLTYCGLSYVNQVLTYSKDENLINLAKALYAYNQAANAYFGQ